MAGVAEAAAPPVAVAAGADVTAGGDGACSVMMRLAGLSSASRGSSLRMDGAGFAMLLDEGQ